MAQEVHPHGEFRNFVKDVHEYARKYGYWRFGGKGNLLNLEARAFRLGFLNPEQLLSAYNHGACGPWHEEITLTWIPGNEDSYKVARIGITRQHVSNIAEERTVLGLPPLLADEIPVS